MNGMYNASVKEKYLSSTLKVYEIPLSAFFQKSSKYESKIDKDIIDMNIEQAKGMLETSGLYSYYEVYKVINFLEPYINWAKETGITKREDNPFELLQPQHIDLSSTLRSSYFKDDKALADFLNDLYDGRPGDAIRPISCFLWMGIPLLECARIKKTDVSEDSVIYKDRVLLIPKVFKKILRNYEESSFVINFNKASKVTVPLIQSGFYLRKEQVNKSVKPGEIGYKALAKRFVKLRAEYHDRYRKECMVSADTVFSSGSFFRIKKAEDNGALLSNELLFESDVAEGIDVHRYRGLKVRCRLWQYQKYKQVFWR